MENLVNTVNNYKSFVLPPVITAAVGIAVNSKITLQDLRNFISIPRSPASIALATLITGLFYTAVACSEKHEEDFDLYPKGKFSLSNCCSNGFLLAVPGILRYLLTPTHLDRYIPYNAQDLFRVSGYVIISYLVINVAKKVWELMHVIPSVSVAPMRHSSRVDIVNFDLNNQELDPHQRVTALTQQKVNALALGLQSKNASLERASDPVGRITDLEARVSVLEDQGQQEGLDRSQLLASMSQKDLQDLISRKVEERFQERMAEFKKGEQTPRGNEGAGWFGGIFGLGAPAPALVPNPVVTPPSSSVVIVENNS